MVLLALLRRLMHLAIPQGVITIRSHQHIRVQARGTASEVASPTILGKQVLTCLTPFSLDANQNSSLADFSQQPPVHWQDYKFIEEQLDDMFQ